MKNRHPIAIVGIGAMFPGSGTTHGFWRDILAGRDCIGDVPATHWLVEDYYDPDPTARDKTYCRRGAFLPPATLDPLEFGIPPQALAATDTAQLLALIVAREVLDEACRSRFRDIDRSRTSIVLGVASATELVGTMGARLQRPVWVKALREAGLPEAEVTALCDRIASQYVEWQESTFPGVLGNVVAGRIANRLDLGGTNCVVDAACASSLSALLMAMNELELGHSDMVISGGVDALNDIFMYMCFSKTPALSKSGDCRPFSDASDGTIVGEGLGLFALRRLEDAERDGNRIYAVIRGIGSSSDGRATSVYAPRPEGQAVALRRAYADAGYGPRSVELVEAHGTGTRAGDLAEFTALTQVFREADAETDSWCAIGSIKSQIGHTKAAAGSAGLLKAALSLHQKVLPPTIKVERPDSRLKLETSPFYLNTRARPWVKGAGLDRAPRRASVSSFGFGGSNYHVALEEYSGSHTASRLWAGGALVLAGGADAQSLADAARTLAERMKSEGLEAVARDSRIAFDPAARHRLAIVAADTAQFEARLATALSRSGPFSTRGIHLAVGEATGGKVAFLFPGQGSQYVGMGADLAVAFDEARAVWDAQAALPTAPGQPPLHRVVFPPPAFTREEGDAQDALLTRMLHAQPAIGTASLALLAVLERAGLRADAVAGHSFGEITALCAAGAIDRHTALTLAGERARCMEAAAAGSDGAMIAVAAGRERVAPLLQGLDVVLANDNGPEQVVLSGARAAVESAVALLEAEGLRAVRLKVASAFHSPVVAAASKSFRSVLENTRFGAAAIPVYANLTAAPYGDSETRDLLAGQIAGTVRFRETIEALYGDGVRTFVEVGPGAVLTGLVAQCLDGRPHLAVPLDRRGADGVLSLLDGLGALAVHGVRLDFEALWAGFAEERKPRKPSPAAVQISGANFGKIYPPQGGAAALPKPNPPRPVPTPAVPIPAAPASSAPVQSTAFQSQPIEEAQIMVTNSPAPQPAPNPVATASVETIYHHVADAHAAFQRAIAESHQALLAVAGQAIQSLSGVPAQQPAFTAPPAPIMPSAPAIAAPQPMPVLAPAPVAAPTPPMHRPAPAPTVPQPVATPRPQPVAVPIPPAASARDTVLAVIAEKTGYPVEMLSAEMELEAGLGIDSIKQVEIFSTLQERIPALGTADMRELNALKTIGQILAIAADGRGGSPAPAPVTAAPAAVPSVTEPAVPSVDVGKLFMGLVAEKTGYPVEMLSPEMELEAGLGIDSIKQVEIFSALVERLPDLASVEMRELTALKTVGAVIARIRGDASAAPQTPQSQSLPALSSGTLRTCSVLEDRQASGTDMLRGLTSIAVIPDSAGVAAELVTLLSARGIAARLTEEPGAQDDGVLFLAGLDGADAASSADLHWRALAAAKAVAPRLGEAGGAFVTVQNGRDAWLGLGGLVLTAAHEWPAARVKAIGLEAGSRSAAELAQILATELTTGDGDAELRLTADGRRLVRTLRQEEAADGPLPLPEGAVIVVSGGARGVTAVALEQLSRHIRPTLVILGRSDPDAAPVLPGLAGNSDETAVRRAVIAGPGAGKPPREIEATVRTILAANEARATLRRLEAAGARVRYCRADVRDAASVAQALATVRAEAGPISGIVHGAGVLADKRIGDKTRDQFDAVFGTKVDGIGNLLEATRQDPVRVICLFSSIASLHGNAGQCDYAMANGVLNAVARAEAARRPDCTVKAIAWGPWDGGMVGPALKQHFRRLSVGLIAPDDGAAFMLRELSQPPAGNPVVSCIGRSA
ncbi:SDR family oxidoreductase [Azospirillum melinis]|uniref:SDR family oxidoreductase n=1 Tax=Azospirillum melinis TaxID=328839 RepID=A0ABX2KCL3_9PROT|nr:type I polyketide synthase [Azospirillum melinis]MBP2308448.1 acyl transferase domain-containing protein/NADP-dependent 3-hydroxy acid dehydrogenase YdfG [Azospirillum melinis]NUB01337.1 SDR family oxidoreductase [Azospirillum melinis]